MYQIDGVQSVCFQDGEEAIEWVWERLATWPAFREPLIVRHEDGQAEWILHVKHRKLLILDLVDDKLEVRTLD